MKRILLTLTVVTASYCSYAQSPIYTTAGYGVNYSTNGAYLGWNMSGGGGETNFVNSIGGGWMGGFTFDNVTSSNVTTRLMTISSNGNVGIGNTNPATTLYIQNAGINYSSTLTLKNTSNNPASRAGFTLENDAGNQTYLYKQASGNTDANDIILYSAQGDTRIYTAGSEQMRITNSGTVGIGTTDTKGYKLAVNGNVIATAVTVKLYADWPDYVFKPTYHLPSLTEVKSYIDKNEHLPEMPSAADVAKDGINLGEIVKLQTKKIEELTLYLIQQKEDSDKQNQSQQEQINELKSQLSKLIKQQSN